MSAAPRGAAVAVLSSSSRPNLASVFMHERMEVTDAWISSSRDGVAPTAGLAGASCPAWGRLSWARDGALTVLLAGLIPAGAGRGSELGKGLGRVFPAEPAGEDGRIPRRGATRVEVRPAVVGYVPVASAG